MLFFDRVSALPLFLLVLYGYGDEENVTPVRRSCLHDDGRCTNWLFSLHCAIVQFHCDVRFGSAFGCTGSYRLQHSVVLGAVSKFYQHSVANPRSCS